MVGAYEYLVFINLMMMWLGAYEYLVFINLMMMWLLFMEDRCLNSFCMLLWVMMLGIIGLFGWRCRCFDGVV